MVDRTIKSINNVRNSLFFELSYNIEVATEKVFKLCKPEAVFLVMCYPSINEL